MKGEETKDDTKQGERGEREETLPGEPSRTPGSAEGDRETVEAALREHERDDNKKKG